MIRILFVCHGNICRSTMAQYVLQDMVDKRCLTSQFAIDSAACRNDEIGSPVDPRTRRMLESQGVPCGNHIARRLRRDEAADWDMVVGMDGENMRDLKRQLPSDAQAKCFKLMEFAGQSRDVADPWYTLNFDETYDDVVAGCQGLLSYLGIK